MVKGYFDQLGCQQPKVYDPGITEWGQQSNPVEYAKCDEGAKHTIVIYWQYDTMPVTQPDLWIRPPFAGDLVAQAAVQEGADRPRRHQLQGSGDGEVECADVHQGGDWQAAREHHLRRRGR